jgi:peptidoglycan/xylan/chitin deacetylase (PgdA/CDA1 family)
VKPLASLSLDLDNQWSYMKTHGDAGWESFPSYLDVVVPRFLDFLARRNLRITVFIVGQDAALEKNREALARITAAGHEVGNHSFHHEPWLHLYGPEEVDAEIARAEESIEAATGARPRGFRGPGFSLSLATLRVLARRGYTYDASTFPTYIGPFARWYYFMTAKLTPEEREQRKLLFGSFREGRRPLRAYRWRLPEGPLTEIPVTTLPVAKLPFHVSYLLYLGIYSHALAKLYLRSAIALCKASGVEPSLLLHPLDFLGGEDVRELAFFPAMGMSAETKLARLGELLDLYCGAFEVVGMREHAAAIAQRENLRLLEPRFDAPG